MKLCLSRPCFEFVRLSWRSQDMGRARALHHRQKVQGDRATTWFARPSHFATCTLNTCVGPILNSLPSKHLPFAPVDEVARGVWRVLSMQRAPAFENINIVTLICRYCCHIERIWRERDFGGPFLGAHLCPRYGHILPSCLHLLPVPHLVQKIPFQFPKVAL